MSAPLLARTCWIFATSFSYLRSSGAPGEAWSISWDERSPPCELSVRHVAIERRAAQSVRRSLEMRTCQPQRQQIRFGLVTQSCLVSPPDGVKPDTGEEPTDVGAAEHAGWWRAARRERSAQEPGRPGCGGVAEPHGYRREYRTAGCPQSGIGGVPSSGEVR